MASILNNTTNGQFLFADHATDFGAAPATAANSLIIGTPTDAQMDCGGVAAGAGRQSAKFDFGTDRPPLYRLDACMENATAQPDGEVFDFWICGSPSTTAGTGNAAGLTGSDAGFTTTRGLEGQMIKAGTLQIRNNVLNIGYCGMFRPTHRYGILVMVNNTSGVLATTADEIHLTLTPVEYDQGA